jgi:hypothetical protein
MRPQPLFTAERGRTVVMALDTALTSCTCAAITSACSTASTTAGNPTGSTPFQWPHGRLCTSPSLPTPSPLAHRAQGIDELAAVENWFEVK